MRAFLATFAFLFVTAFADQLIEIENPPSGEENEGELCLIPDINGNLYVVNTSEALSEPIPHFSPRFAVHFDLFTLDNKQEGQPLNALDENLLHNSNFNSSRPTRFVTHGWNSRGFLTNLFREGRIYS